MYIKIVLTRQQLSFYVVAYFGILCCKILKFMQTISVCELYSMSCFSIRSKNRAVYSTGYFILRTKWWFGSILCCILL